MVPVRGPYAEMAAIPDLPHGPFAYHANYRG
jgi:hypothetical protein